jgi:hypothetical protein
VLNQYGIINFEEVLHQNNVLFWGNESELLKNYFEKITGKRITVSSPLQAFPPGADLRRIYIQAQ